MAVEIIVTATFEDWYGDLDGARRIAVIRVVDMPEQLGPKLGFPYSSNVAGSRVALRELRVQSKGEPLRILYVFEPVRRAVLLLGGSKRSPGKRWYKKAIPLAERLYDTYLRDE